MGPYPRDKYCVSIANTSRLILFRGKPENILFRRIQGFLLFSYVVDVIITVHNRIKRRKELVLSEVKLKILEFDNLKANNLLCD
jgi:hypothetical protein